MPLSGFSETSDPERGFQLWADIGRPYFMFEGEFRGYIGSGIDISDSKAARKALQTMQSALERNSRFVAMAASIAHEVSQPLAAVLIDANAGLRWLARSSPNLEEARAALTRIVAEGNRASEVVQGIRAMLKRGGEQSVPVAVNDLVLEVLTILDGSIQSHRITVQTELSDPLPQVLGDRVQLQEVILNLITNAVESMDTLPDRERVLRVT